MRCQDVAESCHVMIWEYGLHCACPFPSMGQYGRHYPGTPPFVCQPRLTNLDIAPVHTGVSLLCRSFGQIEVLISVRSGLRLGIVFVRLVLV